MPDNIIDNSVVERYAGLEGRDLIKSILRDYPGKTALVSSFGAESAVLLHMISEVDPKSPTAETFSQISHIVTGRVAIKKSRKGGLLGLLKRK